MSVLQNNSSSLVVGLTSHISGATGSLTFKDLRIVSPSETSIKNKRKTEASYLIISMSEDQVEDKNEHASK